MIIWLFLAELVLDTESSTFLDIFNNKYECLNIGTYLHVA